MICRNCNTETYHVRTIYSDGRLEDTCGNCGLDGVATFHDVYFDKPGQHHGIYNTDGEPIFITSRSHKAYEMKKQNLREAGDRIRGAINYDPTYARIAKENLRRQS